MSKRNENRQGYKKTKIGWIPEGWKICELKDVSEIITGSTPKTSNKDYYGNEYLFVGPEDIGNEKYILKSKKMLSERGFNVCRKIKAGSTLFVCIGSTIGKIAIAAKELVTNQQINSVIPNDVKSQEFIYYSLAMLSAVIKISAFEQAVPIVNKSSFSCYTIPFPPIAEQQKIAEILSAWDCAIDQTKKLIEAKQALKKGLMQQLLTGRLRFPQFGKPIKTKGELPDGWKEVRLGHIANVVMGSSPPSRAYNDEENGLPLIQGNADISNRQTSPSRWTSQITSKCLPDDIIMTVRAPVGEIAWSRHTACIGRGACIIRPEKEVKKEFIFQLLISSEDDWNSCGQGSTFACLTSKDIYNCKFKIPKVCEQELIASIFDVCDRVINSLYARKQFLKTQKKAIMQKLLTGEIRVKIK